nr:unnamed protein product [Callosobruchus chinensis]
MVLCSCCRPKWRRLDIVEKRGDKQKTKESEDGVHRSSAANVREELRETEVPERSR